MKEKTYEKERAFLSPYATKSYESKGRLREEPACPMRTDFQRDRDRIIYSKAFLRLKNKTQVFFAPDGDHYMSRLTHTLDVSQIARSLARCLSLNEDLAEAIALGHDLGHTPFGHVGERVLASLNPAGFRHSEQSLRVVDVLEKDGKGLNLTFEVRNGIVNHTKSGHPATLEGAAVSLADRIAYINHDIDDAIRAGIIREEDLPADAVKVFGRDTSERINAAILYLRQRHLLGVNVMHRKQTRNTHPPGKCRNKPGHPVITVDKIGIDMGNDIVDHFTLKGHGKTDTIISIVTVYTVTVIEYPVLCQVNAVVGKVREIHLQLIAYEFTHIHVEHTPVIGQSNMHISPLTVKRSYQRSRYVGQTACLGFQRVGHVSHSLRQIGDLRSNYKNTRFFILHHIPPRARIHRAYYLGQHAKPGTL